MTLQSVDRTGNGFCGPLVLAAIFGCGTAEAAARIRQATSSSRPVKGMHNFELERTLRAHGYSAVKETLALRYRSNHAPFWGSRKYVDNSMERAIPLEEYHKYKREGHRVTPVCGIMPLMRTYVTGASGPQNWDAEYTPVKRVGPTLAEWIRGDRDPNAFYIVEVNLHYVLVKGRKFVDTFTKGEWVFTGSAPHRRKRIKTVWKVTKS